MKIIKSKFKYIVFIASLVLIYFITGKLALNAAFINNSVSPVWAPTGISIAAFLIWGYRIWPAIFIGAFLVNITTTGLIISSVIIGAGNTLEGIIAVYLITQFISDENIFTKPIKIFTYMALAAISCTVSATIGVTALSLNGEVNWSTYSPIWITWWLGDLGGALTITPVLLLWRKYPKVVWQYKRIIEVIFVTILFIFICQAIFIDQIPIAKSYSMLFIAPLLIWIAFRFGPRETATTILLLSIIAVLSTINNIGPFVRENPNHSLLIAQLFMGIIFITFMPLSATIFQQKLVDEKIRENEERYRTLIETATDAIITINSEDKILFCNQVVKKIFGYEPDELIGKDLTVLIPEYLRKAHINGFSRYNKSKQQSISWTGRELKGLHKNGTEIFLEVSYSEIQNNGSSTFIGFIRDVTNKKLVEEALLSSQKHEEETKTLLASIVESSHEAIIGKNLNAEIISWNAGAERMYGYKTEEVIGKHISFIVPDDRKHELEAIHQKVLLGEKMQQFETMRIRKDGTKFFVSLTLSPIKDSNGMIAGASIIEHDITAQRIASLQLKDSLKEKEVLLKEIHHRVKNNLQIVSSLLNLQANCLDTKSTSSVFTECQNRIRTMALVHEKLYQAKDFVRIDFAGYVRDLVANLFHSYAVNSSRTNFQQNIEDIFISVDTVVTLGLIINELVTNSIKHAFINAIEGGIFVSFSKKDSNILVLTVADTGNGLPKNFNINNTQSLGLRLVTTLVDQLNGNLETKVNKGTEFIITFSQ